MSNFDALVSAYLFGTITPGQFAELQQMLREDSTRMDDFAQECYIHHCLRVHVVGEFSNAIFQALEETDESHDEALASFAQFEFDGQAVFQAAEREKHAKQQQAEQQAELARQQHEARQERLQLQRMLMGKSDQDMRVMRHYVIPLPLAYAAVAALLIAGVWIASLLMQPTVQPSQQIATQTPNQALATLIDHVDAQWEDASHAISVGRPIQDRHLKLTRGAATLRMASEAEVTLEAPCVIELVSDNEIRLHEGKLVGLCETPASKNFKVRSRNVRVTDIGTQFGVAALANQPLEAHVFDGEIIVETFSEDGSQSLELRSLKTGQAVQLSALGSLSEPIRSQPARFVREVHEVKWSPADRYAQMILAAEPYGYWRFESADGNRAVKDETGKGNTLYLQGDAAVSHSAIAGGLLLTGNAKQDGHAITGNAIADFPLASYTIEFWAKPSGRHWGVMSFMQEAKSEKSRLGFGHIEMRGKEAGLKPGTFRFVHGHGGVDTDGKQSVFSDRVDDVNRWFHIVAIKNSHELSLYINGQLVGKQTVKEYADVPFDLLLGRLGTDIGALDARYFSGLIDEYVLYPRLLTADEIHTHHEMGRVVLD